MRFDTGLWDRIFGKRLTINVPGPEGGRQVSVTERWFEKMQAEGRIAPSLKQHVTAHILDPARGYYTETWQLGKEVKQEDYESYGDRANQTVYVLIMFEAGKRRTMLLRRDLWEQGKRDLDAI